MEFHDFINLVARKRKTIFGIIAIFIILGVGVAAVQRFKYSSKSQLLVVQENNQPLDAYTASKSNEYLSSVLANVVSSNSFFTKVLESGFDVNADYFGDNPKDQMKQWQKTVKARSINDSGIIAITAYHPNRAQAERIDRAINHVLMTQNSAYHGFGDNVKVRLIDQPITSNFPVEPNVPLILGLSIALGFVVGLIYVYLIPVSSAPKFNHKYGQHETFPKSPNFHNPTPADNYQDMIGEGGYLDDVSALEQEQEEIAHYGNIKNILR